MPARLPAQSPEQSCATACCSVEPAGFSRYDLFDPVVRCPSGALQRAGSDRDGGKLLCGVDDLKARERCVVLSIGSNGQYDFEQAFLNVRGGVRAGWEQGREGRATRAVSGQMLQRVPGCKARQGLNAPQIFMSSGVTHNTKNTLTLAGGCLPPGCCNSQPACARPAQRRRAARPVPVAVNPAGNGV